ncbi:hypothetical protein [Streptomyces ficellus]|uniref:Uncharacterized protein n=1 Tax=Streptomyces ficellus TaxID=1977088 RepID=A0A6I6F3D7_9ACTN|nr:hypothetical protein [Streptomyces ficellus]QGV77321.1 hypothetical protein EIZ62_02910 [Streptomyces ficellus]
MRLIICKERSQLGPRLRFTDTHIGTRGPRLTAFATNTTGILIAELERRHRQRTRGSHATGPT